MDDAHSPFDAHVGGRPWVKESDPTRVVPKWPLHGIVLGYNCPDQMVHPSWEIHGSSPVGDIASIHFSGTGAETWPSGQRLIAADQPRGRSKPDGGSRAQGRAAMQRADWWRKRSEEEKSVIPRDCGISVGGVRSMLSQSQNPG